MVRGSTERANVMNPYPNLSPDNERDIKELLRIITLERASDVQEITQIKENLNSGYTQNTGEITLTPSASSTVVSQYYVRPTSTVLLIPTTQNASLEMTSGNFYVVSADKQFTVNHTNNAFTDKTFRYVVFGI